MKIEESLNIFLDELSESGRLSEKTLNKYAFVLSLFLDYLASYGDLPVERDEENNLILLAETKELAEGHIADFLEWFLIRKFVGPKWVYSTAPKVLKRYVQWLNKKGLLPKDVVDEMLETIEKDMEDLPRVEKAASLIDKLCLENSIIFSVGGFEEEDYREGYGIVTRIEGDKLYLDYEGEEIGPILITEEIAKCLKKDDTVNLVVAKKEDVWYPLEAGFVYPRPLI